ncbi:MAG: PocR ligand-binding domain-containing protein, partial [Nitrospirota bacterium]
MDRTSLPEACRGWHQIQESLSRLTGMEFALYNEKGDPAGMASGESPFCRSIRRGGPDDAFCESQCGRRLREAVIGEGVLSFKCASGQNVFFMPVRHGDITLVVSGGKTFSNREDYKKALKMIKAVGGRVSMTGKHRYRYIGKRRLAGVVELVKNTAFQHFHMSHQKSAYQLRYSRQAALLESAGLLHGENNLPDIAGTLLRSVITLFDADTASLIFYGEDESATQAHYVAGDMAETVRKAGEALERGILGILAE